MLLLFFAQFTWITLNSFVEKKSFFPISIVCLCKRMIDQLNWIFVGRFIFLNDLSFSSNTVNRTGLLQRFVVFGSWGTASCVSRFTRSRFDHHTRSVLDSDANGSSVHFGSAENRIDATAATASSQFTSGCRQEAAESGHFGRQSENDSQAWNQARDQTGALVAKNTNSFAGPCGSRLINVDSDNKHRHVFTNTSVYQQFIVGRSPRPTDHNYDFSINTESCVKYHCTYQIGNKSSCSHEISILNFLSLV